VVRIEHMPKIGETAVDENLTQIGKVIDIIGPVSSPYATVKPTVKEPEKFVNKRLYIIPSKKGERGKRE
jgi:rRNA processing protein Gar1